MKREMMALVRAQVRALDFRRNHGLMDLLFLRRARHRQQHHQELRLVFCDCTRMQKTLGASF